jgi:Transposase DDE domain group 1
VNATSTRRVVVEAGGTGIVAHTGLHALGAFADRLKLPETLSAAIPQAGERAFGHDRGKVLTQAMLMLAGGGESCADIEYLRDEEDLFGSVPSDTTLYRTFANNLRRDAVLGQVKEAFGSVRREVWRRSAATSGSAPVVLDLDSSLVEVHSENKEGTGPHYKGGYGFHPMFCVADATGEVLAAELRPGNAAANTVADHLQVLDDAITQLPEEVSSGHRAGEDRSAVRRTLVVRTDSAGGTHGFAAGLRERNVSFSLTARHVTAISNAIAAIAEDEARWAPALTQDEHERRGAEVAEVTEFLDLSAWPTGTRLVVRREPLHPGAQQSLFPSLLYRYVGFYTDQSGDPVSLDVFMRAHAHVEETIARLKDSGLLRFPFTKLFSNRAWLMVVCMASDLVRWFQLLCLTGSLASARPKALRWRLWHAAARCVSSGRRTIIRIPDGWPDAEAILSAYRRIALIT